MCDKETMEYLESVFDGRYVRKKDCDRIVEKNDDRIDQITVTMTQIATKLNLIAALLGGIGAAILAAVVKLIFGG